MNFSPMNINLFVFKVNSLDRASTAGIGPNQQLDFFVSTKRNQGIEDMGDFSPTYLPITNIMDADLLDSNSSKGSVI